MVADNSPWERYMPPGATMGVVDVATDMRIVSAASSVREMAPAIVSVRGPVDVQAGSRLLVELHRLMASGTYRCVVDLSEATSFGATGLAALLTCHRRASAADGWVRMVNPPPAVMEYLTGTLRQLPFKVHDTVEEATA
jgi:anti-anti-sigma regulatory factor